MVQITVQMRNLQPTGEWQAGWQARDALGVDIGTTKYTVWYPATTGSVALSLPFSVDDTAYGNLYIYSRYPLVTWRTPSAVSFKGGETAVFDVLYRSLAITAPPPPEEVPTPVPRRLPRWLLPVGILGVLGLFALRRKK